MLSRHFSLGEFTRSDTARRLGISNMPEPRHKANLRALACGLEQVRRLLGDVPLTITSGYRSPRVNAAVGGVPTSAHALGYAADFSHPEMSPLEVCRAIETSVLTFDQLIYEPSRNITHISFDPRFRREVKTQAGGPGSPVTWGLP
ncbi:MAG: D-Ala-D-Ala carboxypeptidase family metallohydrolase [Pseudomonadota bacterium]|nr:D-Ala-D-Ala carboxypeptidase family metallohydrolase [Pseudomonadota bacterium]